ncbi:MAG: thymidine phosphorylase [archaeon]
MKLKIKLLKWSAGRPVVILHNKLAKRMSLHLSDRILIRKNSHKIISIVDFSEDLIKESEIAVSTEVISRLKLKKGDFVRISLSNIPESIQYINKKLRCGVLKKNELKVVIKDIVSNALTEAEIAYFVSSIYKCGMNLEEIKHLIEAMVSSGRLLKIDKRIIADKHSIGGVAGRTTPIVVAICAADGLVMPKTSSRAITTAAGTADALETLCKVEFSISEIKKIINKTDACIIWGGSLGLAPADDKIIQVEKLLMLDPEPQLIASIMAKKLAVNAKYIVIHIPYGKDAKVDKKEALSLQNKFLKLGKKFKIKICCILTKAEQPMGNGIGPVLEMNDVIKVLKREDSCFMLEKRALLLSGTLLELTGKVKKGKGFERAYNLLDSGMAWKKFQQIIKAQKGRIINLKPGKFKKDILSEKGGKISEMSNKKINHIAITAGCPLDKMAGIYLYKHIGNKTKKGEKILTIYSESKAELEDAVKLYNKLKPIKIN